MLKDRVLAGTMAGMIAALIKDVPNYLLWKFGIVKSLYFHLASSALISPKLVDTPIGLALGITVDIITGGTLGLLLIFLFKFTGRDFWWYKGLIIGNAIWLWGLGIVINMGATRIVPLDPIFRLTSLVEHQIFGLVGALLIVKWYPETNMQPQVQVQTAKLPFRRHLIPEPVRKQIQKQRKDFVKPKKL